MDRILGGLAAVLLAVGLWLGLGVAPRDAVQGNVQRIMYVHVPAILTGYAAFGVVLVGERGLPVDAPGGLGPRGRRRRRAGRLLRRAHPGHRVDLGEAHLGHLVDVGRAAHARPRSCS